jgi:transposase
MIAIGVDVHKRLCQVAMVTEDGQLRMLPSMENTRENWEKLVAKLPPEAHIAVEVSTSGYFAMSVLEALGCRNRSHWVHTAGIDSLRKQKYDRLDARRLARKLSVADRDPLPEAWFPPLPIRELRLRARQRCRIMTMRTRCQNRLSSLLQMYGARLQRNPFSAEGRKELKRQKLSDAAQDDAELSLRLYDFLTGELETSEKKLETAAAEFPEIARLDTVPGIGRILAATIWSELGDMTRFRSAGALVNDTGLVPSLWESGEVSVHGHITRQGPTWLRWALVAAANAATHGRNPFARRYRKLRRRGKRANVAKTAIAVSIARCVYGVLKHGEDYQEERWGRRVGNEMEQKA